MPATASRCSQQVVAKDPARYDAQLLLGHHWHDDREWPEAIIALEAYFAHRPDELAKEDARHQVDLADAYLRCHQPQKALALFEQRASSARRRTARMLRARIGVAWATAAIDCQQGARRCCATSSRSPSSIPRSGSSTDSARSRSATRTARSRSAGATSSGRRRRSAAGPRARRRGAGGARQPRRGAARARDRAHARAASAGG